MKAMVELRNFTEAEVGGLPDALLIRLQMIRYLINMAIHITSGFRTGDDGTHGLNEAVDISDNRRGDPISSEWRYAVLKAAYAMDFKRIGVYDKHIHLDISFLEDQDVAWWDVSD